MKSPIPIVFLVLMTHTIVQTACAGDMGPLQVQNRFPLHFMFLTPKPANAQPLVRHELRASAAVDYSNVYFQKKNDFWDVLIDMELTVVDLQLSYGLTSRSAIKLEIPFAYMGNGVLDGFLQEYHDTLNVGDYGRQSRPENQFAYDVSKEGRPWLQGQPGRFQLADLTVSAQYALPAPHDWETFFSAVWVRVQLPTGDAHEGFGSGRFDFGLYAPMQWSGKLWTVSMMPGVALLSNPKTLGADVNARKSISMFGGTAYHCSPVLDLNAQVNFYTSPIEKTGISQLDDGAIELALGFKYRLSEHWTVEFAFCEDLMRAAPDFTVHLGLAWHKVFHRERN